jgi:bacteriorhodopsin
MFATLFLEAAAPTAFTIPKDDFVGFTFFVSMFALLAAGAFFLLERSSVLPQWRTPLTVAGIICIIAGVNYYFMRGMYIETHQSPTQFRYVDWVLTVPLLCAQFYLLLSPAGAKTGSLWVLATGAVWMIGFGYLGEISGPGRSIIWGSISTLGYLAVVYEVWFGRLGKLVDQSESEEVVNAFNYLGYFIIIGWSIYPIGYMMAPGNLLSGLHINMNLVYNLGDVVNKLGFGFIVYTMARAAAARHAAEQNSARLVA